VSEYCHVTDGSTPAYTVDWGPDNPVNSPYPEEKMRYLGFASEEKALEFINTYLKGESHRLYKGTVKLRNAPAIETGVRTKR
jgi:hypothetical protein